jgi:hypothetical protein
VEYVKFKKIDMKRHPEFNEKWVQERIAEDPSILGLGELLLRDKERIQPRAGRLDLLLQDPDSTQRYEVEIQLGKTDEAHIIRAIEYWDIERKRYPQYDHTAVVVAEDITSRFLNVISLFNGFIPLVALQLNAVQVGSQISLVATTVLDQMTLGLVEDDGNGEVEKADRAYWEKRGSKETVAIADDLLEIIKEFKPDCELNYNKFYIGLTENGRPNNFADFRPKKAFLGFAPRLKRSEEIEEKLDAANLDWMDYNTRMGRYRIRLVKGDVKKHRDLLKELLVKAAEG